MAPARHVALLVARLAGAADVGADVIDRAGGRFADLAGEGGATVAGPAHAGAVRRDQRFGNARQRRVILEAEARPIGRIGTAGAAAPAWRSLLRGADRGLHGAKRAGYF